MIDAHVAQPFHCHPLKTRIRRVKYEILRKAVRRDVAPEIVRADNPESTPLVSFFRILKKQIRSAEFWLGIVAGVGTRITVRLLIVTLFNAHASSLQNSLLNFAACAVAGAAAGIAAFWIRALYRNRKLRDGEKRERYIGKAFFRSALTGLSGGLLGSGFAAGGAMIVHAGTLAASVSAGAIAGVPFALAVNKNGSSPRSKSEWIKWALQCATFGAAGGAFGVVCGDLFNVSMPLSVNEASAATNLSLASAVALPGPAHLHDPTTTVSVHAHSPPHRVVAHAAPHSLHHHARRPNIKVAHAHHHAIQHIARSKGHAHMAHMNKNFETRGTYTIVEGYAAQPPLSSPPPIPPMTPPFMPGNTYSIVPPRTISYAALPQHHAPPLANQINLQGPCADSRTSCVERVFFNKDGDAVKVVLEARPGRVVPAHFEVRTAAANAGNWNNAARGITQEDIRADASNVTLVVPFSNRSLAQGLQNKFFPA